MQKRCSIGGWGNVNHETRNLGQGIEVRKDAR